MDLTRAPAPTGWQDQLLAQRDVLNSRLSAARSAGAPTEVLRSALLEVGPAADHLAQTLPDAESFARAVPVLVDAVGRLVARRAWHESSAERWALLGVVPFLPRSVARSPETTVDLVVHGASRVARGADLGAWGRRLAAADAHLTDDDALRGAAAVAAWRSGFVRVRGAALGAATTLPEAALLALLDLDLDLDAASTAREVLDRHAADPFWWPGSTGPGRRTRVGGFRGDGGTWVGVPVVLDTVEAATPTWRVAADDQVWVVVADVHGSTVLREPAGAEGTEHPGAQDVGRLVSAVRPDPVLVAAVTPSLGSDDTVTAAVPSAAEPFGPGALLVSQQSSYLLDVVVVAQGMSS